MWCQCSVSIIRSPPNLLLEGIVLCCLACWQFQQLFSRLVSMVYLGVLCSPVVSFLCDCTSAHLCQLSKLIVIKAIKLLMWRAGCQAQWHREERHELPRAALQKVRMVPAGSVEGWHAVVSVSLVGVAAHHDPLRSIRCVAYESRENAEVYTFARAEQRLCHPALD